VAQIAGGFSGALVANLMFNLSAVNVSTHHRAGSVSCWRGCRHPWPAGGHFRDGPRWPQRPGCLRVGGYILAAYWFTSSTSFANPAVTIARMFSNTFRGIAPASVTLFVLMQLLGGLLGYGLIRALYPNAPALAAEVAAESLAAEVAAESLAAEVAAESLAQT